VSRRGAVAFRRRLHTREGDAESFENVRVARGGGGLPGYFLRRGCAVSDSGRH